MARFDVYHLRETPSALALDVQADLFDSLRTTIIVPLRRKSQHRDPEQPRLNPTVRIGNEDYVMLTTDMGVLQRARLGNQIANVEAQYRDTITSAIDFLLSGF